MNFATLNAELQLAKYAAMTNLEAADDLNLVNISRGRSSMTGNELLEAQDAGEYVLLVAAKKSEWLYLCGITSHDPYGPSVEIVKDIWGNASTTVANLAASRTETISRATELSLPVINQEHVRYARTL